MRSIKTTALRLPLCCQVVTPSHPLSSSKLRLPKPFHLSLVKLRLNVDSGRSLLPCLCNKPEDIFCPISQEKQDGLIVALFLRRWDVPWKWDSILSTILGCVLCHTVLPILLFSILHVQVHDLGSNGLARCFLAIYRESFDTRKGWLLWAGVGTVGAVGEFVTQVVMSMLVIRRR